jgi:hypothetical protein
LEVNGDGWHWLLKDLCDQKHLDKKKQRTYTPITDCFFGASLLMFARGDQRSRLRGDVTERTKSWSYMVGKINKKNMSVRGQNWTEKLQILKALINLVGGP